MDYSRILVKYGDLTLKGRNKKKFIKQVVDLTHNKLAGIPCSLNYSHDRMYIDFKPEDKEKVLEYFKNNLRPDYKIIVEKLDNFYDAEEYHQDYLDKNPGGYCHVDLKLIKTSEKK